jgi:hypothetical protein
MFNNKIRTAFLALVASASIGVASFAPAAAQAQPVQGAGATGCFVYHVETDTYEEVPEGTLIIGISGNILECRNGGWVVVGNERPKVSPISGVTVKSVGAVQGSSQGGSVSPVRVLAPSASHRGHANHHHKRKHL